MVYKLALFALVGSASAVGLKEATHKVLALKDLVNAKAESVTNQQKVRLLHEEAEHAMAKTADQATLDKEKEDLKARLDATKAECAACDAAERELQTAYETAITALSDHDTYSTALAKILAAKTAYNTELAKFNKQPLLDAISAFKNTVDAFEPTSPTDLTTQDFSAYVSALNAAKALIQEKKAAWDAAVEEGKPSCGGQECTQAALNTKEGEKTTANSEVETKKVARDAACANINPTITAPPVPADTTCQVDLYDKKDFTGWHLKYGPGDYSMHDPGKNDQLSSFEITGDNCEITIYEHNSDKTRSTPIGWVKKFKGAGKHAAPEFGDNDASGIEVKLLNPASHA